MTPHAFVLVPVGIVALLFSRTWLYRLLIISTLFSGTSIFNIGAGDGASGVQVWMFFGCLWLLRDAASRLASGNLSLHRRILVPASWVTLFLFVATLSLIMPSYINGRLQIHSPILTDASTTPLFFTMRNVTSWLYLTFGCLLAISVAEENKTIEDVESTARIYLGAGVFVSLWGFFQLFCFMVGLEYPAFLFNNSASPGALGYTNILQDVAFKRMSSVALEPSALSESILTIIPLTIPAVLNCGYLVSRRFDRICFVLFSTSLIVTASSSAYLGVAAFLLAAATLVVRMKIRQGRFMLKSAVWVGLALPVCVAGLYFGVPFFRTMLNLVLFSKASSYSTLERAKTVHDAFGYFLSYPALGVGWGSVGSHDLVVELLSNMGIAGLLSFIGIIGWISLRLYRGIRARRDEIALTQMTWLLSLFLLMVMNLIGGFAFVLGYMWLVIGVAMSCAGLSRDRPVRSHVTASLANESSLEGA